MRNLGSNASFKALGQAYATAVEEAVGDVAEPYRVVAEPWGGPKTGGPVPDANYLVSLVGVASDWAGRIVDILAFGVLVRQTMDRLERFTCSPVRIDSGPAMIKAAEAIFESTGLIDLTLAFVASLSGYSSPEDEHRGPAGWIVGYRGESELYLAVVLENGDVHLPRLGQVAIDLSGIAD